MNTTNTRDFRSLSEDTQAELRRLAFSKIDEGWTQKRAAEIVEVSEETVSRWMSNKKDIESRDCRGMKRGRELYEQRILTKKQEETIKKNIETKTPQELGLPYALWNRKAIQHCIQEKTKQKIWLQTVSKYTNRWGLTPQRPTKYAYEQDKKKIKQWLEVEYPKIEDEAKKQGAEIHWGDESGVALSTFYARSYAPKGKTPTIRLPARQGHISFIASITNRGDMRFMMYRGALNTSLFMTFAERLIKDTEKKIYLIVDNLQVHKAKRIRIWEQKHSDRIKLFFPASLRSTTQS